MARLKENAIKQLGKLYTVKSSEQWCEDFADLAISGERYVTDTLHNGWLATQIRAIESKELQTLAGKWFGCLSHVRAAYHYNPLKGEKLTEKEIRTLGRREKKSLVACTSMWWWKRKNRRKWMCLNF